MKRKHQAQVTRGMPQSSSPDAKARGGVLSSDKRLQKTIIILHVSWINDTYFQDGPVSEHGQSTSVLLSSTKTKTLTMNVPPADKAILSCPSSQGRESLSGFCAVNYRGKRSDK